jgi:hypothetical protein
MSSSTSGVIQRSRFLVEKTMWAWREVNVLAIGAPAQGFPCRDATQKSLRTDPWVETHGYRPAPLRGLKPSGQGDGCGIAGVATDAWQSRQTVIHVR